MIQHREGNDGKKGVNEHGKGTEVLQARLHLNVFVNDISDDDVKCEGK
jgi:hypothetical protein